MYKRILSLGILALLISATLNNKRRLLGIAAVVATLAVAFWGAGSAVRADGGGSISGRVVQDLNGDGIVDANEPGLAGWRVVLESGVVWTAKEVRTGSDGRYVFRDRRAITRVRFHATASPVLGRSPGRRRFLACWNLAAIARTWTSRSS